MASTCVGRYSGGVGVVLVLRGLRCKRTCLAQAYAPSFLTIAHSTTQRENEWGAFLLPTSLERTPSMANLAEPTRCSARHSTP